MWESLNLLMFADSIIDTKMERNRKTIFFFLNHGFCVLFHMLRVTCHLSLTQTATATDPPPSNFTGKRGFRNGTHKPPTIIYKYSYGDNLCLVFAETMDHCVSCSSYETETHKILVRYMC